MTRETLPRRENLLVKQEEANGPQDEVINLYWTKPDDGGQNVQRYRVEVSDKAGYWPSDMAPAAADATGRTSSQLLARDEGDTASDDDDANVAIIHVLASAETGATSLNSYNLAHTVNVDVNTTLYYRVRTETDADDNLTTTTGDTKTSGYLTGSVAVDDTIIDEEVDGDVAGFDPPIPAPVLVADGPTDETPGQIDIEIMTNPANSYRVDVSDDGGKTWEMVHSATRPINPDDVRA